MAGDGLRSSACGNPVDKYVEMLRSRARKRAAENQCPNAVASEDEASPKRACPLRLYKVLRIGPSASLRQVRQAYRRLAAERHPDKGGSEALFHELAAAYRILGDAAKRRAYDRVGDPPGLSVEATARWVEAAPDPGVPRGGAALGAQVKAWLARAPALDTALDLAAFYAAAARLARVRDAQTDPALLEAHVQSYLRARGAWTCRVCAEPFALVLSPLGSQAWGALVALLSERDAPLGDLEAHAELGALGDIAVAVITSPCVARPTAGQLATLAQLLHGALRPR